MSVLLALVKPGTSLFEYRDAARLCMILQGVDDKLSASPLHLPRVS